MQWLSLDHKALRLPDDHVIVRIPFEDCKRECTSWSDGPCKSFSYEEVSRDYKSLPVCRLSHGDQHSNPEDMKDLLLVHYGENCEGKKNTLSQSFDQETNYIKSGKSPLNVREFYFSEFVKMDSASNYTINVYRRRTVCGQTTCNRNILVFFITTDCLVTSLFRI